MDTTDYNLIEDSKVFVVWKWTWLESADIPSEGNDREGHLSISDNGQSISRKD